MLFREQESRQNIFRMLLLLVFVSCHLLFPAVDAAVTCWQGLIETAEVEKKVCDEDVKNCMRRHDTIPEVAPIVVDCGADTDKEDDCYTDKVGTYYCYCNGDLCNGSPKVSEIRSGTILIAVTALLHFLRSLTDGIGLTC